MLRAHEDIIISNLSTLVDQTNLNTLVPVLLERHVLNDRMVSRILNPSYPLKRQKTDLYIQILKRGPHAFKELIGALSATNHSHLASVLRQMAEKKSPTVLLNSSLITDRGECLTSINSELDGPCFSKESPENAQMDPLRKPIYSPNLFNPSPDDYTAQCNSENEDLAKSMDIQDSNLSSSNDSDDKLFAFPTYMKPLIEVLQLADIHYSDNIVNYQSQKNLPVRVKKSTQWQSQSPEKPLCYKMDSIPRGCLLVINNINFADETEYPERRGADNDEFRVIELFKQFHFEVENYRNKTKNEMENIIHKFSQNKKFYIVDCVCVILMSHGDEGESKEESQIFGTDGIGLKALDVVNYFDNDSCKALINKAKLFFFQACRGCLPDPGVTLFSRDIPKRIETDGRKVTVSATVKIRSQSDIFIACPVPPGKKANRDLLTGAWFIQTIVEVFSAHAWDTHLEDLMKLVDQRIKKMNNVYINNFQSLTTQTIGWNKNLFFNPGLSRDQFGNTVLIGNDHKDLDPEEGMDVVDSLRPNNVTEKPTKSRLGNDYSRLKDDNDKKGDGWFKFWKCC